MVLHYRSLLRSAIAIAAFFCVPVSHYLRAEHGVEHWSRTSTSVVGSCDANAGTLTPNNPNACIDGGPVTLISAWTGSVIPQGFQALFLVTTGPEQTIRQGAFMPSFNASVEGVFTLHTLVFDGTLDLGSLQFGVSVLEDINSMLIQGGGTICGSLDMVGSSFTVVVCGASCPATAGTIVTSAGQVCLVDGTAVVSGIPAGNAVVPDGFELVFGLSLGVGHVIVAGEAFPSFEVAAAGGYTIHPLVYDPATFDLGTVVFGETTVADLNALFAQGGGSICASIDPVGSFTLVQDCQQGCEAAAGTMTAIAASVCYTGGQVAIGATSNGDVFVPVGFEILYLRSAGAGLLLTGANTAPAFQVTSIGAYAIHTLVYDPNTLDLGSLEFGVSTLQDINAMLIQGGGSACASLDMTGAPISVVLCCPASAGTITADVETVCYLDGMATISATPNDDAVVPVGFQVVFVLTSGTDLLLEAASNTPSFPVSATSDYTIHTLVYDPGTFDLGLVEFGVTTAAEVNAMLTQGGGTICASLDLAGAPITVVLCCEASAGTITADAATVCYMDGIPTTISATANDDAIVPDGFQVIYVLTSGTGLVIEAANATPSFPVVESGDYTIHTLVYDPATLDLSIVEFGITTASEVNAMLNQGGGAICASLDLAGAPISVSSCCEAAAGTLTADTATVCFIGGATTISATANGDASVPEGFEILYLRMNGIDQLLTAANTVPAFQVNSTGDYSIRTLVYDPTTLDLGTFQFGVTSAADVDALLMQGGGLICGSLDMTGALIAVLDCSPVNDDCANAVELPISLIADCANNAVVGNNNYATQDAVDLPSCVDPDGAYADVWYSFNSGDNTEVSILLDGGALDNWSVAITDACGGGIELACEVSPTGVIDVVTQQNTDYRVRVFSDVVLGLGGEFAICISGLAPTFICNAGVVSFGAGGSNADICQDAEADVLDLYTSSTSIEDYMFVVTDTDDLIVAPVADNMLDFNALPMGAYRVWGISYNGTLEGLTIGASIDAVTTTGACLELSAAFATVNVEVCSGLEEGSVQLGQLFPNPSTGTFTLRYVGDNGKVTMEVLDMDGRLVLREQPVLAQGQLHTVQLEQGIAPGLYTVRLTAMDRVQNLKLVVQ